VSQAANSAYRDVLPDPLVSVVNGRLDNRLDSADGEGRSNIASDSQRDRRGRDRARKAVGQRFENTPKLGLVWGVLCAHFDYCTDWQLGSWPEGA
jgi:hypothetical protein